MVNSSSDKENILIEVQELLTKLSKDYNIDFLLTLLDKDIDSVEGNLFIHSNIEMKLNQARLSNFTTSCIYNNFKDIIERDLFLEQFRQKIEEGLYLLCIDSSNKPEDFIGDWIQAGTSYKVDSISVDILKENSFGVRLIGISTEPPYEVYSLNRFIEISKIKLN